jgi:hypothetical protein
VIVSQCGSCGADVLWITLLHEEGGSKHPVDVEPVLGPVGAPAVGQIAVRRREIIGLVGLVLTRNRIAVRLEEFITAGARWHTSHFSTCPTAAQHRTREHRREEPLF